MLQAIIKFVCFVILLAVIIAAGVIVYELATTEVYR